MNGHLLVVHSKTRETSSNPPLTHATTLLLYLLLPRTSVHPASWFSMLRDELSPAACHISWNSRAWEPIRPMRPMRMTGKIPCTEQWCKTTGIWAIKGWPDTASVRCPPNFARLVEVLLKDMTPKNIDSCELVSLLPRPAGGVVPTERARLIGCVCDAEL